VPGAACAARRPGGTAHEPGGSIARERQPPLLREPGKGIDKIDQLAKVVCADSDRLAGAFHLVEHQQPRGDPGALLDERTFDCGIEPQRPAPSAPPETSRNRTIRA
jgi:hypothetical protein